MLFLSGMLALKETMEVLSFTIGEQTQNRYKCAQQTQMLTHIKELARSMSRPARDLVVRWFDKVIENENARNVWQTDVDQFAEKVRARAVQKRQEEKEARNRQRQKEEAYVANVKENFYVKKEGSRKLSKQCLREEDYPTQQWGHHR